MKAEFSFNYGEKEYTFAVENGKVYTVEGNSTGDTCRQKEYSIDSSVILGYGTPMY